jgi:hypothetical protein
VSAVGFSNAARRNLSASRRFSQYDTTVNANRQELPGVVPQIRVKTIFKM